MQTTCDSPWAHGPDGYTPCFFRPSPIGFGLSRGWIVLEGLLVELGFGNFDDEHDWGFFFPVRPGLADVFLRHQVVIRELRVGTALDDAAAHLRFRVWIAEINNGNGNAWVALRVLAFQRGCFRANQEEIAFARDPDGGAVRRAVGHERC
jgi:hypothetical protein